MMKTLAGARSTAASASRPLAKDWTSSPRARSTSASSARRAASASTTRARTSLCALCAKHSPVDRPDGLGLLAIVREELVARAALPLPPVAEASGHDLEPLRAGRQALGGPVAHD